MFSDKVTFRMFCSYRNEDGSNCSNEAVGEMPVYLDNNPKGDGIMYLPICQVHLEALDKHHNG